MGEVPGSPIASIDPNETVTLFAAALISETTTNTVTVNAQLTGGAQCDAATATATVTVEEPADECEGRLEAVEPCICRAVFRAVPSAGSKIPINRPMIEMTTSNSINVKPLLRCMTCLRINEK